MQKLGKLNPRVDSRNIKLAMVFKDRVIPPTPDIFDVDESLGVTIPNPMFGNNNWGDCVMAARAHMTRRFEQFEQKQVIPISDAEVLTEYWKEEGVPVPKCWAKVFHTLPDNGLYTLDSMKAWRKGWLAAKQQLNIYAFAVPNWLNHEEDYAAMTYLRGELIGIALPISAQTQETWDVTSGPNSTYGSWGGHLVFCKAYDKKSGLFTCVTWGSLKQMTTAFFDKYIDEAVAVVDDRDKFVANSPVDVVALDNILAQITA